MGLVAAIEHVVKKPIWDCRMCGMCVLHDTGMTCPMTCPKTLRNGPCGGVRENGHCEVKPEMRCVWVEAWDGASRMRGGDTIRDVNVAVDHRVEQSFNLQKLLAGNIDEMTVALEARDVSERIERL